MNQTPLTPKDCDLRDFPFMPLDVVRLRDSDLASLESPEACWAAVLLWCASWHQIPAASLPNDDRVLANLSGFGRVVKEWVKVKDGALRGWILCTDGRLYHPVIAEKALNALESKYKQEWRTEIARIKKHNQRHPDKKLDEPDYETWLSLKTVKDCPKGQTPIVSVMSQWKQHPTDIDTDTDIDISKLSNTQDIPTSVEPSQAASVCIAILEVYKIHNRPPTDIAQSSPTLKALIDAGASVEEFRDSAIAAMQSTPPKGFSWILGRVKNQRAEALSTEFAKGKIEPKEDLSWRNDDNQIYLKAQALKIHTQGKNKFELLAAIDKKRHEQKEAA